MFFENYSCLLVVLLAGSLVNLSGLLTLTKLLLMNVGSLVEATSIMSLLTLIISL